MKSHSPILRAYSDLWKMKKNIFPVNIANNVICSLRPFVYMIFSAKIVDELLKRRNIKTLILLIVLAIASYFLLSVLGYWLNNLNDENWFLSDMEEKNSVTEKLLKIDFEKLENSKFASKVFQHRDEATREGGIYNQCLWVEETVFTSTLSIVLSAVAMFRFWPTLFVSVGNGFAESPWLSLVMLICTVFTGLLMTLISGKINKRNVGIRSEYADINHVFDYYRNMISNYKTGKEIRLFKQQEFIMHNATEEILSHGISLQRKIANGNALANGLGSVMFSVLAFGFYLIVGVKARVGLFSVGDMLIYLGCLLQITDASRKLTEIFGQLKSIKPKTELFYEIIDTPCENRSCGTLKPSSEQHDIEFKNVSFSYDNNSNMVLHDLSLKIKQGDRIAIVGENGSGKTTFIKLMCGLYDVAKGELLLNGINVCNYDKKAYWDLFSVVFQDYKIFSLALGENVAASQTIDTQKVQEALNRIDFTHKYSLETMLYKDCSDDGVEISSGEAQKIALARALYRDAPFIILDEPTAALDPYAEFKLYSQFNELVGDKTAIYISHRLSSCRFCDRIAVFDDGRIVQLGSHNELIKDETGKYYMLWNAQAKYFNV